MSKILPLDALKNLIQQAHDVKQRAHAPYSSFRVGAVVYSKTGRAFTGCNVENCSYGGAICAERTALVKAVSEGEREFDLMVIAGDVMDRWLMPCGICRQFMVEFGVDMEVVSTKPDGSFQVFSLRDLLPLAFTPNDLIVPE